MPDGDIFRVVVVFSNSVSNENLSFTLAGIQDGAIAPSISAIGDDVKDWWNTDLAGVGTAQKQRHTAEIALERVTLRRIKPVEPLELQYTTGLPIVGADAGDPTPPQTAALVSLRTANIGKSYRGRVFLPPIAVGDLTATLEMASAFAVGLGNQFETFLNTLAVDAFIPAVYSKKLDIATEVKSIKVDRRLRTQRRRTNRSTMYETIPVV
jgi:hypothetical protein